MEIALDVAGLCTFAGGSSASVPVLEMVDLEGKVARRVVTQTVRSRYRTNEIGADSQLP